MIKIPKTITSLSSVMFAEEALKRKIVVKHLNPYSKGPAFMEFTLGKHKEYIKGQMFGLTSCHAQQILRDKNTTKLFLHESSIHTLPGRVFNEGDSKVIDTYCKKVGYPVVVKPLDGALGRGVHMNIRKKKELVEAVNACLSKSSTVFVEKMFVGIEYRILATRSKVLGVTKRVPANVVGDGKNTISKLITIKNKDPRRTDSLESSLRTIKVDKHVRGQCFCFVVGRR